MFVNRVSCAVLLTIVTAACGGRGPASPSAPTPFSAPAPAASGATILGTVHSAPGLGLTTGSALAGLTVSAVGTDISATVSATGQFTLSGVPGGTAQLRFSGSGVDATLAITPVQGNETVTIVVTVSANRAEVEAHERQGEAELHGTLAELAGSASAFQFRVAGRLVRGDATTRIIGDSNRVESFARLRNGDRVEVKGASRDAFVQAASIHIEDDGDEDAGDDRAPGTGGNDDDGTEDQGHGDGDGEHRDGETDITGAMAGLAGSCPSITFSLAGNSVATSPATEFSKVSCSALGNGQTVKVEGVRQSNGVIMAREVKRP